MGGDFNMVLTSNEQSRDLFLRFSAREFKEALENMDLVDLPLMGGK